MPALGNGIEERYSRQLGVPGWGAEGQRRLAAACVFVAGAGGLGCSAAVYLAAAGVGRLTVCDADRIEPSNLNRQFLYTPADVGSEKATAAAERLRAMNPSIEVEPVVAEINERTARDLTGGATLLLDCLDNLETRFVLNRCSIASGVPMVHAAVSEFTGHVALLHPPATPCLECFFPPAPPPVEPAVPGVTPGLVGALEAAEAIKFIVGVGEPLAGRLLIVEALEPRFDVVTLERDRDCPACGRLCR
ncbi:MAG: HesA/MoeB/ThiF family protein [Candidatus Eisenbacteria bacterium]|nr:HesA/MoeB/ThiF family protein [Candidatus Eisenbacteria bacterium]